MSRISRWMRAPAAERKRLLVKKAAEQKSLAKHNLQRAPFRLGMSNAANLYLAYQPDSQAVFGQHPIEFKDLHRRFLSTNRANNGGDWPRFWSLVLNLKQIFDDNVEGDLAELGVWRGNTAAVLAHFGDLHGRNVDLFDTFEGFDKRDLTGVDADKDRDFSDTSIDHVRQVIGEPSRVCRFYPGWFPQSLAAEHDSARYCAVSLDCDLYDPMKAGLDFFYPRLSPGGLLMLHDYSSGHWPGAKQAIDEFCKEAGERVVLMPDKSGSAFIRRA
ncbi:TylF/MycF/NovP-related O-methyltransferase [Mycolicibacterium sp. ELW1]|uniref:TylF/MycF/NovP-related O-methyltransferase n=1 Tax=Mycobacteriaceae TaxID=1762 RepID=UPI0011EE62EA|nr:TylF/MycF/NovP-related O-methyltransferase [Mycobacterium sp. ELW1]QEN12685.1 hypothetical protein D3H54_04870 [Mycobacterium sp. ELW1]